MMYDLLYTFPLEKHSVFNSPWKHSMKWWCLVVLALSQRYEDVQAQSTRGTVFSLWLYWNSMKIDVIWMDEGETVALPDSRANLTLCFYPETSFYHINKYGCRLTMYYLLHATSAEDAVQLRRQEGQLSSFFQVNCSKDENYSCNNLLCDRIYILGR